MKGVTMATRTIRVMGDEILTKPCKEVKQITPRIKELIEDMLETMYEANGVGLAAPQVGVLRRIVVIDVGTEEPEPLIMVNPVILESSGEQTDEEGCLSLPGKCGKVTRPNYVKAKAFDENMHEYEIEAEGLLARCICHELDHLDGHMYVEKVEGELHDVETEEETEEEA
ncbi:MAG: peptide deformylase [Lachnospiraceae bacterium]|nr:peptide deformylase [Lachnospiraceae bacterium]